MFVLFPTPEGPATTIGLKWLSILKTPNRITKSKKKTFSFNFSGGGSFFFVKALFCHLSSFALSVLKSMSEDLLKKGLQLLKLATEFDGAGQTQQAVSHYLLALDVLVKCHGYEKLDANRALLKEKISLYMNRVEVLKASLRPPSSPSPLSSAVSSVDALPSPPSDPVLPPVPTKPIDLALPTVPTTVPTRRTSVESRGAAAEVLIEKSIAITFNQMGVSYAGLFGPYLKGSVRVTIEDPFLSAAHQMRNLVALVELILVVNDAYEILVITKNGGESHMAALEELRNSLRDVGRGVVLSWRFSDTLHDRSIRLSNGWKIVLGRGLDIWQKPAAGLTKNYIGVTEQTLRRAQECEIHFLKDKS